VDSSAEVDGDGFPIERLTSVPERSLSNLTADQTRALKVVPARGRALSEGRDGDAGALYCLTLSDLFATSHRNAVAGLRIGQQLA
jgi:hypothetical protein